MEKRTCPKIWIDHLDGSYGWIIWMEQLDGDDKWRNEQLQPVFILMGLWGVLILIVSYADCWGFEPQDIQK